MTGWTLDQQYGVIAHTARILIRSHPRLISKSGNFTIWWYSLALTLTKSINVYIFSVGYLKSRLFKKSHRLWKIYRLQFVKKIEEIDLNLLSRMYANFKERLQTVRKNKNHFRDIIFFKCYNVPIIFQIKFIAYFKEGLFPS